MIKGIALLGSTGSIGQQTLAVIDAHPDKFKIISLAAGRNTKLLEKQIIKYKPEVVVIEDEEGGKYLKNKFSPEATKIYIGSDNLDKAVVHDKVKIVVSALSGVVGLLPTIRGIEAGKDIAIANKETLVAAGELVIRKAKEHSVQLLPVDSEHSAIFQCLQGNRRKDVKKLILTASGGPFRKLSFEELKKVTLNQALKHPNWNMGPKITIDSATLMNKGLEVIEAKHLFQLEYEAIQVVIHPQSLIHSMVEYIDGSIIAQLGIPSMKTPIQYALTFPERWEDPNEEGLDFYQLSQLTFEEPKRNLFPALDLAYEAGKIGGTMPAVLNSANEEAVRLFLEEKISFLEIIKLVEKAMSNHQVVNNPNLEEILAFDRQTRDFVNTLVI